MKKYQKAIQNLGSILHKKFQSIRTSIQPELLIKLIISIIFLTSSTIMFIDTKSQALPYAAEILSSEILLSTKIKKPDGKYFFYKEKDQNRCVIKGIVVSISTFFGQKYLRFSKTKDFNKIQPYMEKKDINLRKVSGTDKIKICGNIIHYSK